MVKTTRIIICWLACLMSIQSVQATDALTEYECLHLNIGLFSLLETDNTYFQRKKNRQYDPEDAIAKGLVLLRSRGESCAIKKTLYIEAAEYSLHYRKLGDAEYFLQQARKKSSLNK